MENEKIIINEDKTKLKKTTGGKTELWMQLQEEVREEIIRELALSIKRAFCDVVEKSINNEESNLDETSNVVVIEFDTFNDNPKI